MPVLSVLERLFYSLSFTQLSAWHLQELLERLETLHAPTTEIMYGLLLACAKQHKSLQSSLEKIIVKV